MRFATAAFLSALAAIVSADTPANTANPPSGNPIYTPGLNEQVPVGPGYKITWNATTQGLVDLILLKGPSSNAVPLLTIADQIPNTGSFIWNVPTTLQPQSTGYGIELVVEGSGEYQYSTQFGVSNPNFGTSDPAGNGTAAGGSVTSTYSITTFVPAPTAAATGTGNLSIPIVSPTGSLTVPSSLLTSATGTANSVAPTGASSAAPASTSSAKSGAGHVVSSAGGLLAAVFVGAMFV